MHNGDYSQSVTNRILGASVGFLLFLKLLYLDIYYLYLYMIYILTCFPLDQIFQHFSGVCRHHTHLESQR